MPSGRTPNAFRPAAASALAMELSVPSPPPAITASTSDCDASRVLGDELHVDEADFGVGAGGGEAVGDLPLRFVRLHSRQRAGFFVQQDQELHAAAARLRPSARSTANARGRI